MFQNFLSVKRKRKKKKSASLLFAPQLAMGSRRPRVVSQTILNKQAPLGEMENGTFRTSVKFQWVGAAECVCERFAAIDDLSEEAMKLAFIRADALSPCWQPIIKECFLTVPVPLINTPYTTLYIFPNVYYLLFNSWFKQNEKFQREAFVCCWIWQFYHQLIRSLFWVYLRVVYNSTRDVN